MQSVPALLIALRVLLGPALYGMAVSGRAGIGMLLGLTTAFLSDVFDGVVARRVGVATERIRVADSWADAFFYLWIAAAIWQTRPVVVYAFRWPLGLVLAIQLFSYALDWIKYRRIATFHAYSAKAWGITLFLATVALLGFHKDGIFVWLVVIFGILSNIEGIAIKLILPHWAHDVPSFFHALRIRRAQQ